MLYEQLRSNQHCFVILETHKLINDVAEVPALKTGARNISFEFAAKAHFWRKLLLFLLAAGIRAIASTNKLHLYFGSIDTRNKFGSIW